MIFPLRYTVIYKKNVYLNRTTTLNCKGMFGFCFNAQIRSSHAHCLGDIVIHFDQYYHYSVINHYQCVEKKYSYQFKFSKTFYFIKLCMVSLFRVYISFSDKYPSSLITSNIFVFKISQEENSRKKILTKHFCIGYLTKLYRIYV